jgi:hypothetical protein
LGHAADPKQKFLTAWLRQVSSNFKFLDYSRKIVKSYCQKPACPASANYSENKTAADVNFGKGEGNYPDGGEKAEG